MTEHFVPPGDCPICGEFVPRGAKACRECGSCDKTGWNEDAAYDHLDLPDEAHEEESPNRRAPAKILRATWWRWAALALVIALAWLYWLEVRGALPRVPAPTGEPRRK